ncbi:UNVERIFIED_CONTAM: hypothetical protein PYX00_003393 [Menopon gallinae]|uniref:Uncharacterized protein n=1 Tax=Menopon gallinae TaxID=328185 RepID=A0AAW2I0Y5_9NEOP
MFVKHCLWTVAALCLTGAQAAVIAGPQRWNSYSRPKPHSLEKNSIEDNVIESDYDSIQGLYPPKVSAKDYYHYNHKHKPIEIPNAPEEYVVDTVKKVIKLKTDDGPQETELKKSEEVEIKKLSAAFADLLENSKLENYDWSGQGQNQTQQSTTGKEDGSSSTENWSKLNPIISVSKSGVSVVFGNNTEEAVEETPASVEEDPSRDTIWDALAKSVQILLTGELDRRLNMTEDDSSNTTTEAFESFPTEATVEEEKPSKLAGFISSVWDLMKTSFDYVSAFFTGLMSGEEEAPATETPESTTTAELTTTPPPPTPLPTTTVAVFALEEPTSFHRLPSEEFHKRGRDIDSLLYGYGIA